MYNELKLGDTGNEVKTLQEKLKNLGYYNALITGSFGLSTLEGVKAFQKEINIPDNGIVNDKTWDKLFYYTEPAISPISLNPTLRFGSTGEEVKSLQTKLKNLLYYTGNITGTFDLETENAVKRLQLNNKLTADGIVGTMTWNTINNLYGNLNSCVTNNTENNNQDFFYYKVESGDTLYAIAKNYDTTVNEIKQLNNLTSDILMIGQRLKIPRQTEESYITYVIQKNDTLYSIARKYNTTVDDIKKLNNLTSNLLNIGQVIKIPTVEELNYLTYIVKSGDTLYSIARKYDTTVNDIKNLNGLSSNFLSIGQTLKIPY